MKLNYYFILFVIVILFNYCSGIENNENQNIIISSPEDTLTEKDKSISKTYYEEAVALYEKGQFNEAVKYYNKALEHNPYNASYFYGRALCLFEQLEKYEQAEKDFSYSIKYNPKLAQSYYYRGLIRCKHLNKLSEGCNDLDISLQLGYEKAIVLKKEFCR